MTLSLLLIPKLARDRQLPGLTQLSSPAPSHQLFQSLLESCAGTPPRPALHLLNLPQALVLCGFQQKSVLRVPGPYPTHPYHGSASLALLPPFPSITVPTPLQAPAILFPSVCLETSSLAYPFPSPTPTRCELHTIRVYFGAFKS